ncbi:MAG: M14 family metallocarboxypeptidase [Opitutaceae bacterium]
MSSPATEFLQRLLPVAGAAGFRHRSYGKADGTDLVVLERSGRAGAPHLYLSAGIHGDEPAGPEAICRLLEQPHHLPDFRWTLFPLLNPAGYNLGTRENAAGLDLNRDYRSPLAPETIAHRSVLENLGPLDLVIALHEDWESRGFYLYELNAAGLDGMAEKVLSAAACEGPIDLDSEIDGRPAANGVVHAPIDRFDDRQDWPEQILLFRTRTRLCYTFETPSTLPLEVRIRQHLAACRSAFDLMESRSHQPPSSPDRTR